jgi:hypothetical protein
MDQAYHKAVNRKKELENELAEVQLFLLLYERFSDGTEREHAEAKADSNGVEPTPDTEDFPRPRGNPDIVAGMAEAVLKDVGRPMTRGELAREIENRGLTLPGGDKAKYVGTILWRKDKKFVNAGQGYWLRDLPLPSGTVGEFDLTGKLSP